jgi:predicted dithiol-disulfide oxidoreductase (DUF899 family)
MHFPNESTDYRGAREKLLELEIDARRAVEAAARARRALPRGGALARDYVFEEMPQGASQPRKIRFSELFGDKNTLVIYSYMFGPEKQQPCPMCTPLLDGLDGVGNHIRQRLSFVVVAESPAQRLAGAAKERGWRHNRLVSSAGTTYNADYHGKAGGADTTMLNVFHRYPEGIFHTWGTELAHGPSDRSEDHRGLDLLNPIFAMFDTTPEGRGNWYTKLSYGR